MRTLTQAGGLVIDVGGGLRVSGERSNTVDKRRMYLLEWLKHCDYKVIDPVDTYHPDMVGDIHALPFEDESVDSFVCLAVLEHVERPLKGVREMYRCLKKGGYVFVYMPFLFSYHAEQGYYKDFWRFTRDCMDELFGDFSSFTVCEVRGSLETLSHLLPGMIGKLAKYPARFFDWLLKKQHTKQTSGFYVLAQK